MKNKYNVGDLLTVIKGEDVWYTYLDWSRKEKLGRTGTVTKVEEQAFDAEDLRWFFPGCSEVQVKIKEDYTKTVYSYFMRFPDEPDREINFSEVHLKAFEINPMVVG